MLGITATCAASGYIGQNEIVIHGTSAGKVQQQEVGNNFGGDPIFSIFQTPFFHMQDPEQRKIFYNVATYLRSEGDNTIVMSAVYDYEDVDTLNPTNFNLSTAGAAAFLTKLHIIALQYLMVIHHQYKELIYQDQVNPHL